MRDYLQAQSVEFDDRNIRHSESARNELMALTGSLVVPLVIFQGQRVVGFDPDGLSSIADAYRNTRQQS